MLNLCGRKIQKTKIPKINSKKLKKLQKSLMTKKTKFPIFDKKQIPDN